MKKSAIILTSFLVSLVLIGASCVSFSSKNSTAGPAGMFVSVDKGNSWQQISTLLTEKGLASIADVSVYRLVVDPQDPQGLYLATREHGLFYSYDGGKSWQRPTGVLSTGFVYDIAVHPRDKCTIYATNGHQVFKSDDCNRNWMEIYRESRANIFISSLAFNNFPPYQIYLTQTNGDLFQSFDGGISWSVLKRFNMRLVEIASSPLQNKLIYVISRENGLYRSEDGGNSWLSLEASLKQYPGALEYRRYLLSANLPDDFIWVSKYGILVSHDKGDSWEPLNLLTPPGSVNIYGLAINQQNTNEIYYTATIDNRSTFYRSIDGGENWITKKMPSGQIPNVVWVHPQNTNLIYLGFNNLNNSQKKSSTSIFGI